MPDSPRTVARSTMRQRQPRCGLVPRPLLRVFSHALFCLVSLLLLLLTDGVVLALSISSHLNHHQVHVAFSSASTAASYQRPCQSSSSPCLWTLHANADSRNENDDNDSDDDAAILPFISSSLVSRRDAVWKIPLGVGFAYGYGKVVSQVVTNTIRGTIYPEAHEWRVRFTIEQALLAAATASVAANERRGSKSGSSRTTFRVLEVGIGSEARILRRGLYEPALRRLASLSSSSSIQTVEWTGIDIQLPSNKIQQQVQQEREIMDKTTIMPMQVSFVQQSVEDISFAADGYFDAIVCCLTLCSVENPRRAVQEMRRVLNQDGGTLGFVEHVAVDLGDEAAAESSSLRFLEWQQLVLDPVQQLVADNCHLHRSTQATIYSVMGVLDPNDKTGSSISSNRAKVLHEERFLVDAMWPVSMQCCGVLQRLS
jgi:SAM-dependent methyltransferase